MKNRNKPFSTNLLVLVLLTTVVLAACSAATPTSYCHATGDPANPYQEISADSTNANAHLEHEADLWPVPANGCPTTELVVTDGKIAICHATSSETNPYEEILISMSGLNGHGLHEGDIIPVPETGCPATLMPAEEGKITICHITGSDKNPYNEITVSVNGLNGHGKHEGDLIPKPAEGCPTTKP
jgi:hypothetical protein